MKNKASSTGACFLRLLRVGLVAGCLFLPARAHAADPVAAGEEADKKTAAEAVERALKHAPPNAVGVVHVDVAALRDEIAKAFEQNKEAAEELHGDAIVGMLRKIDTADLFLVLVEDEPVPLIVLHGAASPKDIGDFLGKLMGEKAEVRARGNGRYELVGMPAAVLVAEEAEDLEGEFMLISVGLPLSDDLLASLGKGEHKKLRALLKQVDTTAQCWGACKMPGDHPDAAEYAIGYLDLRRDPPLRAEFLYRTEKGAREDAAIFQGECPLLGGFFTAKLTDTVVVLESSPRKDFMKRAIAAAREAGKLARRAVSASHLSAIGNGIRMYRALYDDRTPLSLAAMVEKTRLPPEILLSPSSGRKTIKTDEKGVPTEPGDYVYIVLPANVPSQLVQAYEKPGINKDKGTNVLFADCHVEWMDMDEFKEALKETEDWLAKQK